MSLPPLFLALSTAHETAPTAARNDDEEEFNTSNKRLRISMPQSKEQIGRTCWAFTPVILIYNTILARLVFEPEENSVAAYVTNMMNSKESCPLPPVELDRAYQAQEDEYGNRPPLLKSLIGDTTHAAEEGSNPYRLMAAILTVLKVPWLHSTTKDFFAYREFTKDEDLEETLVRDHVFLEAFNATTKRASVNDKVMFLHSRLLDEQGSDEEHMQLQKAIKLPNGTFRQTSRRMFSRTSDGERKALNDALAADRTELAAHGWTLDAVMLIEQQQLIEYENRQVTVHGKTVTRAKPTGRISKPGMHTLGLVWHVDQWRSCDSAAPSGDCPSLLEPPLFAKTIKGDKWEVLQCQTFSLIGIVVRADV